MKTRGRPRAFDRAHALESAMRAFWERGYEATSISYLSSVMGINSPSLYAAFGDKQALFRSAVEHYGANEGSIARRALESSGTARSAVETMLRQSVDRFSDPAFPPGCMIVLAAINCTETNPVQAFLAELRGRDEAALRQRLVRAVTTGELPENTDPGQLAAYYHSVLYGLSVQARDGATRAQLHSIVDLALMAWTS
jgi:AcrR family transcriptional regulator